jgi:hypothetical protein
LLSVPLRAMAYEYLKSLSLSKDQEDKLSALGARTPAALLSMIDQVPEKFASFFGAAETERIRAILATLISDEEKEKLAKLPEFRGKFGARVAPKNSPDAQASLSRRDQLMRRIKMIRESGVSNSKTQALLEDLERAFREEVQSSVSGGD